MFQEREPPVQRPPYERTEGSVQTEHKLRAGRRKRQLTRKEVRELSQGYNMEEYIDQVKKFTLLWEQ